MDFPFLILFNVKWDKEKPKPKPKLKIFMIEK